MGLQEAASEAYEHAFRVARAVSAYAAASTGPDPAEAVYEALHAFGAPVDAMFVLTL